MEKEQISKIVQWRDAVLEDDQLQLPTKLLALVYLSFSQAGSQYLPHGLKTVWPSTETLMRKCSMGSKNTVTKHRDALIDAGYLIWENKDATKGGKAVTYRLTPVFPAVYLSSADIFAEEPYLSSGDQNLSPRDRNPSDGDRKGSPGAREEEKKKPRTSQEEARSASPSSSSAATSSTDTYSADHQSIWGTYPRRGDEAESLQAYRRLRASGVPHAVLAASVTAYLADIGDTPKKFMLANFFAKDIWREYVPAGTCIPPTGDLLLRAEIWKAHFETGVSIHDYHARPDCDPPTVEVDGKRKWVHPEGWFYGFTPQGYPSRSAA